MAYTTRADVKAFILDLANAEDSVVDALIANATDLINLELGDSIEVAEYTKRVDGLGVPRIIMENIVKQEPLPVVSYRNRNSDTWVDMTIDYVDKNIIYTLAPVPRGEKNIKVVYSKGYSTIPSDFKQFFLLYIKTIYDISLEKSATNNSGKEIKTKTLGDLSITYFSPSEIMASGYQANSVFSVDYNKILKKYKNFNLYRC